MTSTALSERRPTKQSDAATLAHKVICSYPSVNPLELKGYLAEMVHLLVNYSEGVAIAAVEKAMRASPNFPPPVPLVEKHCDELSDTAVERATKWDQHSREQLREREEIEAKAEPLEHRRKVAERIQCELKEAFAENEIYNVFVPMFAPQYRDMVDRGGRPGVSVDDKTRTGVWVPLEWLQGQPQSKKSTWQRLSAESLQAMYPKREAVE